MLFVHAGLAALVGGVVEVPIAFDSGGTQVAALSFSLEYDHKCLAFDPADLDKNGLPDAIVFNAPGQFFPSVAASAAGDASRIDIILADYIPPLAALRDTVALVTIQFRIVCPVAPGNTQSAQIRFAQAPAVSFSDPTGKALAGAAYDGTVQVIGASPEPLPTLTGTTTPPPPTPPPSVSPTPTPGGTIPPAKVALELTAWPNQVTRTDRTAFLILDYLVLLAAGDATVGVLVPQPVQADPAISTPGWLCEANPAGTHCLLLLSRRTLEQNASGRLFLTLGIDPPLPDEMAELAFTATLQTLDGLSSQTQHLVLPVLPADPAPAPGALVLELTPAAAEVVAGIDHQLFYTLTYTNTSATTWTEVEFHLIVPAAGIVRPAAADPAEWRCLAVATRQAACTLPVDEVEPGAWRQHLFVLELAAPLQLAEMATFILALYATHADKMLSTTSSLIPIRRPADGFVLFLPLIARPDITNPRQ